MSDKNLVIVEMETISVFDFVREDETVDEAKQRADQYYAESLEQVKALFQGSNDGKSRTYWKEQIMAYEKKIQAGCQVITFIEFEMMQRKKLLLLMAFKCFVCLKCIQGHIRSSMLMIINQANIIVRWLIVRIKVRGYINYFVRLIAMFL